MSERGNYYGGPPNGRPVEIAVDGCSSSTQVSDRRRAAEAVNLIFTHSKVTARDRDIISSALRNLVSARRHDEVARELGVGSKFVARRLRRMGRVSIID